MKRILIFIGVALLLVTTLVVVSTKLPSEMRVEQTIVIRAYPGIVFKQVNNIRNWAAWDPWKSHSTVKIQYSDQGLGKGASATWKDENGRQREIINESDPFQLVITEVQSLGGDLLRSNTFRLRDLFGETNLTWVLRIHIPIQDRIITSFMEPDYGFIMTSGLDRLKALAEADHAEYGVSFNIVLEDYPGMVFCSMLDSSNYSASPARISKMHKKLLEYCENEQLEVTGKPTVMWYTFDPEGFCVYEAIIPVKQLDDVPEGMYKGIIPEIQVLTALYTGHPLKTSHLYQQLLDYQNQYQLGILGVPWEVYLTDPVEEPDTNKWQVRVYYPVTDEEPETETKPEL